MGLTPLIVSIWSLYFSNLS